MTATLHEIYPDSIISVTKKAVLFLFGNEKIWIPISQLKISDGDSPAEIRIEDIIEYPDDMGRYTFKIPYWLLQEKQL